MNAHCEDEYRSVCTVPSPVEKMKWWSSMQLYVVAHWCHSGKKIQLIMNIALILAPEEMQKYLEIQRNFPNVGS